jgi:hypothetical protein
MTGELRVPTANLEVEVVCADGRSFTGRIFLPVLSAHHSGAMRPLEWMNDNTPFFPFLPSGGASSIILNKHEVLILTAAAPLEEDEDEMNPGIPLRSVVVECRDRVISGLVAIDMPDNQRRVLDFLNRNDTFLTVRDGARHHLVRKARITRVVEPKED